MLKAVREINRIYRDGDAGELRRWWRPSCCPGCGSNMTNLSEVIAEQLELVSSALKVIRTVSVYPMRQHRGSASPITPHRSGYRRACWAHARIKIHDVYISTRTATAEEALKRIGELYAIEEAIRGLPAAERLAARQSQSKPLMASLHEWLIV